MAQLVEHILGKDEVPGPNPGSSSKHPRYSNEYRGFGVLWGFFKKSASLYIKNMLKFTEGGRVCFIIILADI